MNLNTRWRNSPTIITRGKTRLQMETKKANESKEGVKSEVYKERGKAK